MVDPFAHLLGNEAIKQQLRCMLEKQAIGHALLFAGPEGVGKGLFAQALAEQVLAQGIVQGKQSSGRELGLHPDLHIYRPEGKLGLHSIQSLRQLSDEVHLPPYEGKWKVFIIHEADRMLSYSANALLKTFEEPPAGTLIILLSKSQSALMPTILSRCRTLHFKPLEHTVVEDFIREHYALEPSLLQAIVRQSKGSLKRAIRLAEHQGDSNRTLLLNVLAVERLGSYKALQEIVHTISEQVEAIKKQAEVSAKDDLLKTTDQLSAQHLQALDKEIDGLATQALLQEAEALFEYILGWYRDLQLLLLKGHTSYLMNPDFEDKLLQAVQRGNLKPISQVKKAIDEAYLALQRSTSLAICLENLLLKLDKV